MILFSKVINIFRVQKDRRDLNNLFALNCPGCLSPREDTHLLLQLEQLLLTGVSLCTHLLVLLPVLIPGRGQQLLTLGFPLGLQLSLYERQLPRESNHCILGGLTAS